MRYRLYGLRLESPLRLSCPALPARGPIDVRLRPARSSRLRHLRDTLQIPRSHRRWFDSRKLSSGATYLRWAQLFEFLISADGRTIEYYRLRQASHESLTTYLLGQVLSFSLLSFGYEPLHATAVVVGSEAVAFLGDCGYGKSTLGAAFVARGFPILTDDVLTLEPRDGRWMAHPGAARVKLFPSVAEKVLRRGRGCVLNPGTSKLVIALNSREIADRAVPLRRLYALPDPNQDSGGHRRRVRITPLNGQEAFLEITRSAFNLIRVDRARLQNQFVMASRLANDIPLRRLSYPRQLSRLNDVCTAVIADAQSS